MSHLTGALQISSPRASTDDWFTPLDWFKEWDAEFGFTLDPCGSLGSGVTRLIYPRGAAYVPPDDGLDLPWRVADGAVFCNPPYSNIAPWVAKAELEMRLGCSVIAMLLPANKSEQPWWQKHVEPYRDRPAIRVPFTLETRFLPGRLRHGTPDGAKPKSGTFPSVLLIWRHR